MGGLVAKEGVVTTVVDKRVAIGDAKKVMVFASCIGDYVRISKKVADNLAVSTGKCDDMRHWYFHEHGRILTIC